MLQPSVKQVAQLPLARRRALVRDDDIERIAGRIALFSARPRDLSSLRDSLHRLAELRAPLIGTPSPLLGDLLDELATPDAALDLLSRAILPEPSTLLREGGVSTKIAQSPGKTGLLQLMRSRRCRPG